jgi:hypothetical protein
VHGPLITLLVPIESIVPEPTVPGCEVLRDGWLREPVSAVTSLAFVAAAVAALVLGRRAASQGGTRQPGLLVYAALVAGVGVGSVVEHGPRPVWADVAHDLPLLGLLAFVAADAAAALTGRTRAWWWWAAPTLALLPLVVGAPLLGDLAQSLVAAVAVGLVLLWARAAPVVRGWLLTAVALLAVGALIGTLSRAGGPLCDPDSLWQGHAVWHVLASAALVVLAPAIGTRPALSRARRVASDGPRPAR